MSVNGRQRRCALLISGVSLIGFVGSAPPALAEPLLVGVAKLNLAPPVATPLAGYSRRNGKLATGIHDPPFVRALVMRQDATTVALVSCDLLIVDERLFDAVKARVGAMQRVGAPRLLLAATHTHSGPGAYGQKFLEKLSMGHFDPAVFEFLTATIAQAILSACAQMQPVSVTHVATSTSGLVVNRMHSEGPVDSELAVMTFHDAHDGPVAVVVNFSAHPTTLGAWNMELSADYPGVVARIIEQRYPGAVCLFLAGSVADQAPVKQGEGFERAEWLGSQLATQALSLMDARAPGASSPKKDGVLGWAERTVRLSIARLRVGGMLLPVWLSRLFVDDDATLTAVAVESVLVMGLPCDVSAELGLELKQFAQDRGYAPVIVGFANDYIGYCLPERLYWTDNYEARMAFNGPQTGEMVVEQLKQMINNLVGSRQ